MVAVVGTRERVDDARGQHAEAAPGGLQARREARRRRDAGAVDKVLEDERADEVADLHRKDEAEQRGEEGPGGRRARRRRVKEVCPEREDDERDAADGRRGAPEHHRPLVGMRRRLLEPAEQGDAQHGGLQALLFVVVGGGLGGGGRWREEKREKGGNVSEEIPRRPSRG